VLALGLIAVPSAMIVQRLRRRAGQRPRQRVAMVVIAAAVVLRAGPRA